ncbi:Ubiquitin carboxyl-terminal hydrolase 14 [Actinomortierella wolfii]|nr:Ubiquitin carboxyl-terminal hydrolase 14 [Actinomortierella wolfii]KAG0229770.1 Ubiquitin carboxyl-terminal hydrolase 14 [Actinomortierella wolfii]
MPPANTIKVNVKWNGKKFDDIELDLSEPGLTFKAQLFALTGVDPERQKIFVKGGMLKDDTDMSKLGIKAMMGTAGELPKAPEKKIIFAEDMTEATLNKAMDIPAGLVNLGNTCYMNATLQCLRVVPELVQDLQKYTGTTNNLDAGSNMTASLRDLYRQLNAAGQGVMPAAFLNYLRQAFPQFSQRGRDGMWMQQDAEECWGQLISTLRSKLPPHEEGQQNVVVQYMQGEFTTTLKCDESAEEAPIVTKEPFTKLDCHIDQNVNFMQNGILLSLDQKIEKNSPTLDRMATYTKSQRVSRLPTYLTVSFVRFYWKAAEQVKAKILRKVKFPFELDASQFCTEELQAKLSAPKAKLRELDNALTALKRRERLDKEAGKMETDDDGNKSEEALAVEKAREEYRASLDAELVKDVGCNPSGQYELHAVLTHVGRSADSGHYIGWTRKGSSEEWYKYDDDKVSPVKKDDILKLDGGGDFHIAYLALYKAKEV